MNLLMRDTAHTKSLLMEKSLVGRNDGLVVGQYSPCFYQACNPRVNSTRYFTYYLYKVCISEGRSSFIYVNITISFLLILYNVIGIRVLYCGWLLKLIYVALLTL